MIAPPAGARILLATKPVDFRKGAHSLAALAAEVLGADPFSGAVLVFRSRRADRIKILLWDGSGLVLYWKRLENGGKSCLVPRVRLERTTYRLQGGCSTS